MSTTDAVTVAAVLAEHEPVIGATYMPGTGPRGSIVGCSCLSAREYAAAGFKAGQRGWRDHLAEAILAAEPIAQALAAAWEDGRRHGERNFISCPDDNPHRAALNPGGQP